MEIYIFDPVPFWIWSDTDNRWETSSEIPLLLTNSPFPKDTYTPSFLETVRDEDTGKYYINKYSIQLPLKAKVEAGKTEDYPFHIYYVDQDRSALRWPSAGVQVIRVKGK